MPGRHSRTLTHSCLMRTTACMRSSGLSKNHQDGHSNSRTTFRSTKWPAKRGTQRNTASSEVFERMWHTSNMRQRLRRDIELIWIKSKAGCLTCADAERGWALPVSAVLRREPNPLRAFPSLNREAEQQFSLAGSLRGPALSEFRYGAPSRMSHLRHEDLPPPWKAEKGAKEARITEGSSWFDPGGRLIKT